MYCRLELITKLLLVRCIAHVSDCGILHLGTLIV